MSLISFLLIVVFLIGMYFYSKPEDLFVEEFTGANRCPNMLIQKDSRFYLYNSKLAKVPGVNPIEFENLEDYSEFLDWQRSQGIRCPVLYLQQTYDAQGDAVYKVRPSVSEPQGGLPPTVTMPNSQTQGQKPEVQLLVDATRDDAPYNAGSMPGFDQSSYYVGTNTPLDEMDQKQENMLYSANPMDPNWGGAEYTQSLVDKGVYKENEVKPVGV
jgi:hypothetical protein